MEYYGTQSLSVVPTRDIQRGVNLYYDCSNNASTYNAATAYVLWDFFDSDLDATSYNEYKAEERTFLASLLYNGVTLYGRVSITEVVNYNGNYSYALMEFCGSDSHLSMNEPMFLTRKGFLNYNYKGAFATYFDEMEWTPWTPRFSSSNGVVPLNLDLYSYGAGLSGTISYNSSHMVVENNFIILHMHYNIATKNGATQLAGWDSSFAHSINISCSKYNDAHLCMLLYNGINNGYKTVYTAQHYYNSCNITSNAKMGKANNKPAFISNGMYCDKAAAAVNGTSFTIAYDILIPR